MRGITPASEQRLKIVQGYYESLGLAPGASPKDIEAAFRKIEREYYELLKQPYVASTREELDDALKRRLYWISVALVDEQPKNKKRTSAIHDKRDQFANAVAAYRSFPLCFEKFGFFRLPPAASRAELDSAHRQWWLKNHPDKNPEIKQEQIAEAKEVYRYLVALFEYEYPPVQAERNTKEDRRWSEFYSAYELDKFCLREREEFLDDFEKQKPILERFYVDVEKELGEHALPIRPAFLSAASGAETSEMESVEVALSTDIALLAVKREVDRGRLLINDPERMSLAEALKADDRREFACHVDIGTKEPSYRYFEPNLFFLVRKIEGWQLWYIDDDLQKHPVNVADVPDLNLAPEVSEDELPTYYKIANALQKYYGRTCAVKALFQAPEVFGDDFNLELKQPEFSGGRVPSTPRGVVYSVGGYGPPTMTRLYLDRYQVREKSKFLKSIVETAKSNKYESTAHFFDFAKWLVAKEIINEHRAAIAHISHTAPQRMVSFNDRTQRWVFNPDLCEPLFARLRALELFLEAKPSADSPGLQPYLAKLDQSTIQPIYAEIKRLQEAKPDKQQPEKIAALDELLEEMTHALVSVLQPQFVCVPDQLLQNDIMDFPDSEQTIFEQMATLREKYRQHPCQHYQEMLIEAHRKLMAILWKYAQSSEFLMINDFAEKLLLDFSKTLEGDFAGLLEEEYQTAKSELSAQASGGSAPIIQQTQAVIDAVEQLHKEDPRVSCAELTRSLKMATQALRAEDHASAGARLQKYAQTVRGKSSRLWKAVGIALMILGAVLVVGGILIATATALPTMGLGMAAGAGIAGAGATLFAGGVAALRRKPQGVSASLCQLGESYSLAH